MEKFKKIINNLEYHMVDSTAILAESQPIYTALEIGIAGLSNEASINVRIFSVVSNYLGLGRIYSAGRDLFKKTGRITDDSSEKKKMIFDIIYNAAFSLASTPPVYYLCGARDLKEIAIGTVGATFIGLLNGAPQGYVIDIFRDLISFEECKRKYYPDFIKNRSPKVKKMIMAASAAAATGIVSAIYYLNSLEGRVI